MDGTRGVIANTPVALRFHLCLLADWICEMLQNRVMGANYTKTKIRVFAWCQVNRVCVGWRGELSVRLHRRAGGVENGRGIGRRLPGNRN